MRIGFDGKAVHESPGLTQELDELPLATGGYVEMYAEAVKYFTTGKGKSTPIDKLPDHLRELVIEARRQLEI